MSEPGEPTPGEPEYSSPGGPETPSLSSGEIPPAPPMPPTPPPVGAPPAEPFGPPQPSGQPQPYGAPQPNLAPSQPEAPPPFGQPAPPANPWDASVGWSEPPAYGQPAPGTPGVQGNPAVFGQSMSTMGLASADVGSAFSWASAVVQRFFGQTALTGLLYLVVAFVGAIIGYFVMLSGSFAFSSLFSLSTGSSNAGLGFTLLFVMYAVFWMVLFFFSSVGSGIVVAVAADAASGTEPTAGGGLSSVRWGSLLGASLIGVALTFAGTLALVIPGVLISLAVPFIPMSVIDGKNSATEAIAEIWNLSKANPGPILLGGLLSGVLSFAGYMVCCVGLVVTVPMAQYFLLHLYRGLKGQPIAYWPAKA